MPRVSVIIPTYNRRDFVREAIASVCAQTYRDFELIIVDDGSTDGTARIVEEFRQERTDSIQYIFQTNQGVSAARNHGVVRSSGELLTFLDSDDVWQPEKLAAQIAFFNARPMAQICQTQEVWLRRGTRVNPRNKHRKFGGDIFLRSLELCLVSPSAVMMRRTLFERMGGFDEQLPACEDYDLWLRIGALLRIDLIDIPLVIKRGGHADQLSHKFWGMDRFRVIALRKLLDSGVLSDEQRLATTSMLHKKCRILVHGAIKRGQSAEPYLSLTATYPVETSTVILAEAEAEGETCVSPE